MQGDGFELMKNWSTKQQNYSVLVQMARDYLAIPAMSAASERVFSNGGDIITRKRNRISPDNLKRPALFAVLGSYQ